MGWFIDVAAAMKDRYQLVGAVDDDPSTRALELLASRDVRYLGTTDDWLTSGRSAEYVIGVADPHVRKMLDARFTAKGHTAAILVHPHATLGSLVDLAPGSVVCAGARLTTNILIGRHAHVHVNATIGHDSVIEKYASIYPQGAVSGNCRLQDGATIGAHATVIQGLTVGAWSFVGAGAAVIYDVPEEETVVGVPARSIRRPGAPHAPDSERAPISE